jgi:hypothetical protein
MSRDGAPRAKEIVSAIAIEDRVFPAGMNGAGVRLY